MKTLKQKITAGLLAVGSLFGYHVHQKPTIQIEQHYILNTEHTPKTKPKLSKPKISAPEDFTGPIGPVLIVDGMEGTTDAEVTLIKQATTRANLIQQSDRFMNRILDEKEFTETNNLTNAQIYDILKHNPMHITVEIYDGSWKENYIWKTCGYEDERYPNTVFVNRYFLDGITYLASLEEHEGEGHGQNFHHYNVKATSIPYKLNDYIEETADELGFKD